MRKIHIAVAGLALLLAGNAMAQKNTSNNKASTDSPVVMTVTTVTFAESTGCWLRIHDGHNFTGRTLTLLGDQSLPNLEFPAGNDWEGDIDSVEVGPKATAVLYQDENYLQKKRELKAGEKVADLHKSIFAEGVESLRLTCAEAKTSPNKAE